MEQAEVSQQKLSAAELEQEIREFEAWQREANRVYPFIEREA